MKRSFVLPDLLTPSLRVVFCGTAAGKASAKANAYYAHPGNKFWATLHATGLTPRRLTPLEYPAILEYGIGLTDLAKYHFGNDDELPDRAFDVKGLEKKIVTYRPLVVAFTSKNAARIFFGRPTPYGLQSETLNGTRFFVLCSPSGQAIRFFDRALWQSLADLVNPSLRPI